MQVKDKEHLSLIHVSVESTTTKCSVWKCTMKVYYESTILYSSIESSFTYVDIPLNFFGCMMMFIKWFDFCTHTNDIELKLKSVFLNRELRNFLWPGKYKMIKTWILSTFRSNESIYVVNFTRNRVWNGKYSYDFIFGRIQLLKFYLYIEILALTILIV